jgi:hypothetical protein
MEKYVEKITPEVSGALRTNEVYLKVKGNMKYIYTLMDNEMRFWVVQQVPITKYIAGVNPLFKKDNEIARKRP